MKRYAQIAAFFLAVAVGGAAGEQLRIRFLPVAVAQSSDLTAGDIIIRLSGDCGAGFAEVAGLDGKMLRGTVAANMNQGGTGGSDTITPEGTIDQATFTGEALAGHSHGVGTYAADAHAGTAVADHASHTHAATGLTFTGDLVAAASTNALPNLVTGSTTGGAVSPETQATGTIGGTTAGPSATLTHSVTQPSAHTLSGTSQSVTGGTPAGSINSQSFTGTQFSNLPAFTRVIFCQKS